MQKVKDLSLIRQIADTSYYEVWKWPPTANWRQWDQWTEGVKNTPSWHTRALLETSNCIWAFKYSIPKQRNKTNTKKYVKKLSYNTEKITKTKLKRNHKNHNYSLKNIAIPSLICLMHGKTRTKLSCYEERRATGNTQEKEQDKHPEVPKCCRAFI